MSIQETKVSRKHLVRRNAVATSVDAALKVDVNGLEKLVYNEIRKSGRKGRTGKELLSRFPNLPYSSLTARPSALLRKGLIERNGERRDGAFVLVAVKR